MRRAKLPSMVGRRGCTSALRADDVGARRSELSAMYTAWAARRQMGDAAVFLQGATQAYAALGLHIASKMAKRNLSSAEVKKESDDVKPSSTASTENTEFMSPSLVEELNLAVAGNPFELAHPQDVVAEASIILFSKLEESATAKNEAGLHFGIAADGKGSSDNDVEDAMVMTAMHVMLPPERFLPNYAFYRSRLVGGSEELARSAAVWLASTPVYPLAYIADAIHRLLGKGPLKMSLSEEYCRSALNMTDDAIANPPLYRKNVLFRLDAQGRWLLESVDNVGFVFKPTDSMVL